MQRSWGCIAKPMPNGNDPLENQSTSSVIPIYIYIVLDIIYSSIDLLKMVIFHNCVSVCQRGYMKSRFEPQKLFPSWRLLMVASTDTRSNELQTYYPFHTSTKWFGLPLYSFINLPTSIYLNDYIHTYIYIYIGFTF